MRISLENAGSDVKGHGDIIDHTYSVSPKETGRYYLWLLLFKIPGAASFFDIFTLKHFNEMIEDYIHDAQQNQTSYDPEYDQEIYNDAFLIFNVLSAHKITLANYERFFLPATNSTESYATTVSSEISKEINLCMENQKKAI
ncbi:hypothetical protein J3Q64DRAFT_1699717 [Phycomyces blakesleeanus]|uniref:Uncharacterized protein n=1 Tax=Phycomyces blakesleeanus TaxID=4837 RepID=A0ABR3AXG2_PHYBL